MGQSRYGATSVIHNGIKFDSQTELSFFLKYEHKVSRNTNSVVVWQSADGTDKVEYTTDFIDNDTGAWIEIKGGHFGFKDPEFHIRWILIKDYCKRNNIKLVCLIPYNGQWINVNNYRQLKMDKKKKATANMNEIVNLIYKRKTYDKDKIIELVAADDADWLKSHSRYKGDLSKLRNNLRQSVNKMTTLDNFLKKLKKD